MNASHTGSNGGHTTLNRCLQLLEHWHAELQLNRRESTLLAGNLKSLERQLDRLAQRRLRVAVFGRVGVGKSSLVNALVGAPLMATDVAHGCTRQQQVVPWPIAVAGLEGVDLVDTPGIDEVAAAGRARLAARVALQADLVLLVLDGDINRVELEALEALLKGGKPVLPVLNRSDCWPGDQLGGLLQSIRSRIDRHLQDTALFRHNQQFRQNSPVLAPLAVAAAPRQAVQLKDGRVRSRAIAAQITALENSLQRLLQAQGPALLALNALRQAERLQQALESGRLRRRRQAAQGLIGRYAALKAAGVATNPLVLLDLAGGLACDTALVVQLCQLYDLPMGGPAARRLLQRLSGHNALIGGAQIGIQFALSGVRQLLLLIAPLTAGLSLAPAAPVALAQAALAVHTTRRTGRLTARWLLEQRGRGRRGRPLPSQLLRRLAWRDATLQQLLADWPQSNEPGALRELLP